VTTTPEVASLDPNQLAPGPFDPEVAAIMRDEVTFCLPSTPVDAVAKLLADNALSEIVVLLDRRPIGYVRQEDILDRLIAGDVVIAGSDFAVRPQTTDCLARDVLRPAPLLVDEHQRVSEVVHLMAGQRRRLAVVMHDDETVVGVVGEREVASHALRIADAAGATHA